MNAPEPRAVPASCPECKSPNLAEHCEGKPCRWVRCRNCKAVSGIAYGRLRSIGIAA